MDDARNTSIYPIGAIVAFAGAAVADQAAWMPCDGSALPADQFEQLHTRIGDRYGTGPEPGTFCLPDYRGRFLRGASDVVEVGEVEAAWTGPPTKPFLAAFVGLPTSTNNYGSGWASNGARRTGDGSQTIDTCTSGGDGDTRPVNVSVTHWIRVR